MLLAEPPVAPQNRFRSWRLIDPAAEAAGQGGLCLGDEPQFVGSEDDCSLRIDSSVVAPRHAKLWRHEGVALVQDLGGPAGTYVNSRRIDAPCRLGWGDLVQFGDADFRLIEDSPRAGRFEGAPRLSLHGRPIVELDDPRRIAAFDLVGKIRTGAWQDPKPVHVAARELCRLPGVAERLADFAEVHAATGGERPAMVLHANAQELLDFGLHNDLCDLHDAAPQVTFLVQVHQAAFADVETTRALQLVVHALEMQLACTGFADRPSRLQSFREVAPDFICLDARDLCGDGPDPQVGSATAVAAEARRSGIRLIARGVAAAHEMEACRAFGATLGGGPLFGALRPID